MFFLQARNLPFAGRLSQFPDAWLLPLCPLLLRVLYLVYQSLIHCKFTLDVYLVRRLFLYLFLFNVRGWFLYLTLNAMEDRVVAPIPEQCWYRPFFQPICLGRVFDFSDHIVLYMAQILPIALTEFIYAWEQPYWRRRRPLQPPDDDDSVVLLSWMVPWTLIAGLAYLYFITLLGAYKTASYFHTASEVYMGLVVSLWIHIPLWWLQTTKCSCTRSSRRRRVGTRLRHFFFPPTAATTTTYG
jgi:hypothetical protein